MDPPVVVEAADCKYLLMLKDVNARLAPALMALAVHVDLAALPAMDLHVRALTAACNPKRGSFPEKNNVRRKY